MTRHPVEPHDAARRVFRSVEIRFEHLKIRIATTYHRRNAVRGIQNPPAEPVLYLANAPLRGST